MAREGHNLENCYWDADAPGVYRKIFWQAAVTNPESNPLAVYVYYAGNMSDRIAGAVGGSTLLSVGANPGDRHISRALWLSSTAGSSRLAARERQ